MKLILCGLLLTVFGIANAQTSALEFCTEDGENFTIIVNGERKNALASTNVKINDLSGDGVKVQVNFQKAIPALEKYFMLTPGERSTFEIKKNKKGEYAFRLISTGQVQTIAQDPYSSKAPAISEGAVQGSALPSSTVATATTTTTSAEKESLTLDLTISTGSVSMTGAVKSESPVMTMSVTAGAPSEVKTTTTTTTSSSSSSYTSNQAASKSNDGSENCRMNKVEYDDLVKSANSKSFADSKMTVLKQALKNKCVNTDQVKSLAELFSFEEDKLAFVKFAYDYTSDKDRFYKINDIFSFEDSIKELDSFLEGKR
jgi:uncharacterized protein YegP (UPF0339 family)